MKGSEDVAKEILDRIEGYLDKRLAGVVSATLSEIEKGVREAHRDQRHACAEAVAEHGDQAHSAAMNAHIPKNIGAAGRIRR